MIINTYFTFIYNFLLTRITKNIACTSNNIVPLFTRNCYSNPLFVSDFQKLEREARICRKLQHPNIGKFHAFYRCDGGRRFDTLIRNISFLLRIRSIVSIFPWCVNVKMAYDMFGGRVDKLINKVFRYKYPAVSNPDVLNHLGNRPFFCIIFFQFRHCHLFISYVDTLHAISLSHLSFFILFSFSDGCLNAFVIDFSDYCRCLYVMVLLLACM